MALVIRPEEGFSTWTEKKMDLLQLIKARHQGDHVLSSFGWAYLLHEDSNQFDGDYVPEDHRFYSNFRHGDEFANRSDEFVASLLKKFANDYNVHIDGIESNWDAILPLLDQIIEKHWGKFGAMFIDRSSKTHTSIIFTCVGVEQATALGKTIVELFGEYTTTDKYVDGMIHVKGPVFYSGGRIFWHSFMRTMGFSTIKGPKYQAFAEIQKLAEKGNFFGVSNVVALLDRFWDKTTHYGLYVGQAELDI